MLKNMTRAASHLLESLPLSRILRFCGTKELSSQPDFGASADCGESAPSTALEIPSTIATSSASDARPKKEEGIRPKLDATRGDGVAGSPASPEMYRSRMLALLTSPALIISRRPSSSVADASAWSRRYVCFVSRAVASARVAEIVDVADPRHFSRLEIWVLAWEMRKRVSIGRRKRINGRTGTTTNEFEISSGIILGVIGSLKVSLESLDLDFAFLGLSDGLSDLILSDEESGEERVSRFALRRDRPETQC